MNLCDLFEPNLWQILWPSSGNHVGNNNSSIANDNDSSNENVNDNDIVDGSDNDNGNDNVNDNDNDSHSDNVHDRGKDNDIDNVTVKESVITIFNTIRQWAKHYLENYNEQWTIFDCTGASISKRG